MKLKILFLILYFFPLYSAQALDFEEYSKSFPKHLLITKKQGGHTIQVEVSAKKFNPKKYKLSRTNPKENTSCFDLINGQPLRGLDGYCHGTDPSLYWIIDQFKLTLDGKKIPISSSWYESFLMPLLEEKNFQVRFADDAESVFVFANGSDAAGAYQVVWNFRKDGHHSRYSISSPDPVGTVLRLDNFDNEDGVVTNYKVLPLNKTNQ